MKPDVLLVEPMMAPIEASLDLSYCVHRLFEAPDWKVLVASIAPEVRGIVTGGATGASNDLIDRLPALEIIAINGFDTVGSILSARKGGRFVLRPLPTC